MYPYYYPYAYYPYPYPMWAQEQRKPLLEDAPTEKPPTGLWTDRVSMWFGIGMTIVTVLALLLGAVAPSLVQRATALVPRDWTKVFDGPITASSPWALNSDCQLSSEGLDVSSSTHQALCAYQAASGQDLVSHGVLLVAQLAPAGQVTGNQRPVIQFGTESSSAFASVNQTGQYELCAGDSQYACQAGTTVAWHGDGYIANTIAVRYEPTVQGGRMTLYANDQKVASQVVTLAPGSAIVLSAAPSSEAVYTHVTLYSAQG